MKQDNELLPCPFCGAGARHWQQTSKIWSIQCNDCGAESDLEYGRSDAIAAWNRRAPDARDARIAELEAAGQWGGWMPLDQAPQGELMLFCDMKATELRASFFVDWMVGGKFCGNRHHTATHCMKLPLAPKWNEATIEFTSGQS